jgi:hypothetical protein
MEDKEPNLIDNGSIAQYRLVLERTARPFHRSSDPDREWILRTAIG